METFTEHIGKKIRFYRKKKGYTLEQFSAVINKSKASVSKYENGSISIDALTLLDIANVLDISVTDLVDDYKQPGITPQAFPQDNYFNHPEIYMYYYDGRIKRIVKALVTLSPAGEDRDRIKVRMYLGIKDFAHPSQCYHLYTGIMKPYDTITHFMLENQTNKTEMIYISAMNPFGQDAPAVGVLSGISSNPFAPVAFKVLMSRNILPEDEALFRSLKLSKDDLKLLKFYNMLLIKHSEMRFSPE